MIRKFLNLPYFNGDRTTRYAFKSGNAVTLDGFNLYEDAKVIDIETIKVERPKSNGDGYIYMY